MGNIMAKSAKIGRCMKRGIFCGMIWRVRIFKRAEHGGRGIFSIPGFYIIPCISKIMDLADVMTPIAENSLGGKRGKFFIIVSRRSYGM
jgi:hypothetical protein